MPAYYRLKSGERFCFTGRYSIWVSPTGEEVCTCTVIINGANEFIREVNDRMSTIVARGKEDSWLNLKNEDWEGLQAVLKPCPSREMEYY